MLGGLRHLAINCRALGLNLTLWLNDGLKLDRTLRIFRGGRLGNCRTFRLFLGVGLLDDLYDGFVTRF